MSAPPTTPIAPLPRAERGTALYVHLPFCAAKCHYCDFFSVPDEGQDIEGLLDAVIEEARRRAPERPSTVFVGGGTPSLLSVEQLKRLFDALDESSDFRSSATEVSAECNPESLDEPKARALLELGVRRLSIGFQTLHDQTLAQLGRVHSAEDSMRAYDAARRAGFEDVNVDLIYALPGQSVERWESELGRVLALGPDHLSAYNLTFEEDTRFRRWLDQGRLEKASDDLELACLAIARERSRAAGLEAYEISNYARPGRECRHNLGYWRNRPYVGIGPSAVSKVGERRAGNAKALVGYRRMVSDHGHAAVWEDALDAAARLAETWWLGLRLRAGVDPARARRRAGFDAGEGCDDPALATARRLESTGHLELEEGSYRLTEQGLPVADAVAAEFLRAARNWTENRRARGDGASTRQ